MKTSEIKKHNSDQFLKDLKRVSEVMVKAPLTGWYFKILKKDVLKEASEGKIHYYLTNEIFKVKRDVMVIL